MPCDPLRQRPEACPSRRGWKAKTAPNIWRDTQITLSQSAGNASQIIDTLSSRQNSDGGFGGGVGNESNSLDTAWVLLALKANGANVTTISGALNYLGACANGDGGYSALSRGASDVYTSSLVLMALQAYSSSFNLAATIASAKKWLLSVQNAGVYGDTLSNAVSALALIDVTPDAGAYGGAVNALSAVQKPDGSWDGDPYLTALALRALSGAANGPLVTNGQIVGTVVDATTQSTLGGVHIQLLEAPTLIATSGSDGKFTLTDVPPGGYTVRISTPGYAGSTIGNVSVTAGDLNNLGKIPLMVAANSATLSGQVGDGSSSQPLAGANVTVSVAGLTVPVSTDLGGNYLLAGLSTGAATITVSKAGYDSVTTTAQLTATTSFRFSPSLYPSGTTPNAVSIRGRIVDGATGAPLAGATFSVGSNRVGSDVNGSFTLTGLTVGAVNAVVDAAGYSSLSLSGLLALGENNVGVIRLDLMTAITGVSGVITDATSKQAIAGAMVAVQGSSLKAISGADGRYLISGIAASTQFSLNISAPGYVSRNVSASIGAPGNYTVDATLEKAGSSGISVTKVTTNAANYAPYSKVEGIATLTNNATQNTDVTVRVLVIDSKGGIAMEIQPNTGPGATNPVDLPVSVPAAGSLTVPFSWYALSAAAGNYVLLVRASDLSGRVVAEGSAGVTVTAAAQIGGGITLDPPITQMGAQPVHITANLNNFGNMPVPAGAVQVSVTLDNPDSGATPSQQISLKSLLEGGILNATKGAVFDAAGNLYVVNSNERKVIKIQRDGQASVFATGATNSAYPFQDLVFDRNGNLLVLADNRQIIKIAPDGTQTIIATELLAQFGIDADPSGNIYVTGNNASGKALLRIDAAGNKSVLMANGLSTPTGVVQDAAGVLYVTNYGDNTISKIAPGGKISAFVGGLNRPQGITLDGHGDIYVANSGANNILKITPAGVVSVYASGFSNPYDLRFDAQNNLFVSNSSDNTIARVDGSGAVSIFARSAAFGPESMKYDATGNLYIANAGNNTLTKVDTGDNVSVLSTTLSNPRGMAISSGGEVFVANYNSNSVSRISGGATTVFASGVQTPYGLAMDAGNNLYVAEKGANRISVIDPAGKKQTVAESLVNTPQEILIDATGAQYVLNAQFIARLNGANAGSVVAKGFSKAISFAVAPGGGFYVLDNYSTLKKIDATGAVVSSAAISSSQGGLVADSAGNVYVTDYGNRNITKIDSAGVRTVLALLPSSPLGLVADGNGGFYATLSGGQIVKVTAGGSVSNFVNSTCASKLALDGNGNLYAACTDLHVVKVYDPAGALLKTLSGPRYPTGIAVTAGGEIAVVESRNQQVGTYNQQGTLIASLVGYDAPGDLIWTGDRLIFSGTGKIYSLVPGQNPQVMGTTAAEYLAWKNGELYFTNGGAINKLDAAGNPKNYYTLAGSSGLSGLAARGDGAMSVGSRNDSRVQTLNSSAQVIASYAGLQSPQGLAVDASGNVYVANSGIGNILHISPSGKQSKVFSALGVNARGLALDGAGQLYATGGNTVYKIGASGTASRLASGGSATNGMVAQGGSIYVTDASAGAIRIVNGSTLDSYAYGLGAVSGVRAGPDGAVYVAGGNSGTVTRYADGMLTTYATGLNTPQTLVFDPAGNLYIGGTTGALAKIDSAGRKTDLNVSALLNGKSIDGLAVDASHTLHATLGQQKRIYKVIETAAPISPAAGTVVYSAQANIPDLPLNGNPVALDFGHWTPAYGGDYSIKITAQQPAVGGLLSNGIHVGPNASGVILADKSELTPGQNTVGVQIKLKGADFTSVAKVDKSNLVATVSTQGGFPKAMPADRAGNLYLPGADVIKVITPSGQMSHFATVTGLVGGAPIAIDSRENLYVAAGTSLRRIARDGVSITLATLSSAPIGLAVDSKDNVLALLSSALVRIAPDGTQTAFNSAGITTPYALTVDGHDNIYVQNTGNVIAKILADGTASILVSPDAKLEPQFEYEGINVAGDCADNVFLTPFNWQKVGQSNEEHTLVQIVGGTGQVANILDGYSVKPVISDMDLIAYDRFSSSLFIWSDVNTTTYKLPVTCGAIGVDLHVVLPQGQTASGFNVTPSAVVAQPDGTSEYVWSLKDVTAFGQDVRFDTVLDNLALGSVRPLARAAFLVFKNSFVAGDVRVPLEIPQFGVASPVKLSVTTGQPEYPAQTDVTIAVDIANATSQTASGTLRVDILDAQGVQVKTAHVQNIALPPAGTLSTSPTPPFNSADFAVGNYTVRALLQDAQGIVMAENTAPFRIVSGANGGKVLSSSVSLDKIAYSPFDTVNIQARVINQATNQLLDNLSVGETVTDSSGKILYNASQSILQLGAGALRDLNYRFALNNAPPGTYLLQQKVTDSGGQVLDSRSASFTVLSTADNAAGLVGSVSASPRDAEPGASIALTATATNRGNADMVATPLNLTIVDPSTQKTLAAWTYTADLTQGQTFNASATWNAVGSGKNHYVVVLSARLNGKETPLATDNLNITESTPVIKLDVKRQVKREARLLVLLTCRNGETDTRERSADAKQDTQPDSGQHDDQDDHTCQSERSRIMGAALTSLGLVHHLSTTQDDFKEALRSGQYNLYWLSGGAAKIDDTVLKEIREAVYRGDGLLVEGTHDERNKLLDDIGGVTYRGKLSAARQPVLLNGALYPSGNVADTSGQALKFTLNGGVPQARFLADMTCPARDCEDDEGRTAGGLPAIVSNSYGKGRSIVAAFDFMGTLLNTPASNTAWQEITQATLDYLAPSVPESHSGGAYAVVLTRLANQGQPVKLQVTDTLPSGAYPVATRPQGQIDNAAGRAKWTVELSADQSAELALFLRLPGTSGSHLLTAQVDRLDNGQSRPYGSYPLAIRVDVATEPANRAQLIKDLQALDLKTKRDREARDQAVKALQEAQTNLARGKVEDAIEKLLDAAARLGGIGALDISAQRLQIDRQLQETEFIWQPVPPKSEGKAVPPGEPGNR